ncbi:hypothetical protein [Microbacterium gorillae]|uniref:hypothetical protein n=1 Tax=Microbacterium gorillae TaxID=1231063 RepID=UPI0005904C26|nr:hypothetical protein [Microbacterium gorillae]
MGMFTQRPEEDPADWTGLPSEPLRPQSAAEALEDAPDDAALSVGLGADLGSISIPMTGLTEATTNTTDSDGE